MSSLPRILVVGVGSIGERHVRCFLCTGQVVVSIVEPRADLRGEVASRYGIEQAFESLDASLENDFAAAVICTPAQLHVPQAIQCAKRGLHLLIEKPLSTDRQGLTELHEWVSRRKLVAAVAYVMRCHPALGALHTALQSGEFGRPVEVVASSGQHFPTYRPAYREIYYRDRKSGGGAIQDALTHVVNAAEWLVGPVTDVAADAAHLVLDGVSVEDTVHVLTRHAGILGCFSLNQHQAPSEFTLTVVCERGTLRFENHRHRFSWMTEPGGQWEGEPVEPLERDMLFVMQAEKFLAAIAGQPVVCSLAEGEQTLRVNLAILAAAESRTWIKL